MRTLPPSKTVGTRHEAHMWRSARHQQHGAICSSQMEPPPTRRSYKFNGFPPQQFSHPPGTVTGGRLDAEAPRRAGEGTGVPATGSSVQRERQSHIRVSSWQRSGPQRNACKAGAVVVAWPTPCCTLLPTPCMHMRCPAVLQAQVAQRLHLSEEEADRRLQQLQQLLPGLEEQLHRIEPAHVAHMASDVTAVAARLLQASTATKAQRACLGPAAAAPNCTPAPASPCWHGCCGEWVVHRATPHVTRPSAAARHLPQRRCLQAGAARALPGLRQHNIPPAACRLGAAQPAAGPGH
jgi:hypothetical protein